jgi:hypothetical protein
MGCIVVTGGNLRTCGMRGGQNRLFLKDFSWIKA